MTKKELTRQIAEELGATQKDTAAFIDAFTSCITNALANDEEVGIPGFGKFVVVKKEERTVRAPKTGDEIIVPAHRSPKFKPASALKDSVY